MFDYHVKYAFSFYLEIVFVNYQFRYYLNNNNKWKHLNLTFLVFILDLTKCLPCPNQNMYFMAWKFEPNAVKWGEYIQLISYHAIPSSLTQPQPRWEHHSPQLHSTYATGCLGYHAVKELRIQSMEKHLKFNLYTAFLYYFINVPTCKL
jgi:hypothetical protein